MAELAGGRVAPHDLSMHPQGMEHWVMEPQSYWDDVWPQE